MIDTQADVLAALRAVDTLAICDALELAAGTRSTSGFTLRPAVCADPGLPPAIDRVARRERLILEAARRPGFDVAALTAVWGKRRMFTGAVAARVGSQLQL